MALAAIAVAVSFMYFAMGLSSMLGIGGTTAAGIKLGDGDEEGARDVYGTILVFSLIVSVIVGVLCIIFMKPLLILLGATSDIYPYAADYAKVFFASKRQTMRT